MKASPAYEDWVERARAVPIEQALGNHAAGLKRQGRELVGPCPVCKGRDRFGVNLVKQVFQCRGSGAAGDSIALIRYLEACGFNTACEKLLNEPKPGSEPETEEERNRREAAKARRAAEAAEDASRRAQAEAYYRERERTRTHDLWRGALPIAGTLAETYLAHRCLVAPPGARLRFLPDHAYYVIEKNNRPRFITRGPAMVAAITDTDGVFRGLHATWLDPRLGDGTLPASASGKATIIDPETGEVLDAKKTRGSPGGNRIELVRVDEPKMVAAGEGIETTLSCWRALRDKAWPLLADCAFWSAISLQNLCGKAVRTVPHPTERIVRRDGRDGGPRRIQGPEPDLASQAITIPDRVEILFLIGDGDSDPFFTQCALTRAGRRHARRRDGSLREIRIPMAPPGRDWNDVLRGVGEMEAVA